MSDIFCYKTDMSSIGDISIYENQLLCACDTPASAVRDVHSIMLIPIFISDTINLEQYGKYKAKIDYNLLKESDKKMEN